MDDSWFSTEVNSLSILAFCWSRARIENPLWEFHDPFADFQIRGLSLFFRLPEFQNPLASLTHGSSGTLLALGQCTYFRIQEKNVVFLMKLTFQCQPCHGINCGIL
ncbi:hypothetical protein ACS0TY_026239 [Phlomoides rotata]